jgi:hypothetical protein|tara:strand:+ start:523 stop:756 length:234 start_codon:yes stop_codon:yes gene_type:complete
MSYKMSAKTYTKDDVIYEVAMLSPEAQSIFGVLVAAKSNLDQATLEETLARSAALHLITKLDEHLIDDAIIEPTQEE